MDASLYLADSKWDITSDILRPPDLRSLTNLPRFRNQQQVKPWHFSQKFSSEFRGIFWLAEGTGNFVGFAIREKKWIYNEKQNEMWSQFVFSYYFKFQSIFQQKEMKITDVFFVIVPITPRSADGYRWRYLHFLRTEWNMPELVLQYSK